MADTSTTHGVDLQGYDLSDAAWVWDEMLQHTAQHGLWVEAMSEQHDCPLGERSVGN